MWIFLWYTNYIKRVRALEEAKNWPTMDEYNSKKTVETTQQQLVLEKISSITYLIMRALPYMPKKEADEMFKNLNIYKDALPIYVENPIPIYVPTFQKEWKWSTTSRRRWGRRSRRWFWLSRWYDRLDRYKYTLNNNFQQQINTYIQQVTAIEIDIPLYTFNYCPSGKTLLNRVGLEGCGTNTLIQKFRDDIQYYKNQSNKVMEIIKDTDDFPQYAQAKQMDDYINAKYDWYPMDERSSYNNGYAKDTKQVIEDKIKLWTQEIPLLYDLCVSKETRVGVDLNNIPICVKDDYMKAAETCGKAIQMSNTYDYGTDKLTDLWTDVSNSIPGNISRQSSLILDTANDSCKKWVDMFNIWEEKEAQALSTPCTPERPIASANDKVLVKMADDWNKSATAHIQQLKERLFKIQKYIQNYPNVLDIKKNGVTLAPYSMSATALIKKDFSDSKDGEGPKQYLEMIIPNGEPGETGNLGSTGISGEKGRMGSRGPEGAIGKSSMPSFYNIFNPNSK